MYSQTNTFSIAVSGRNKEVDDCHHRGGWLYMSSLAWEFWKVGSIIIAHNAL